VLTFVCSCGVWQLVVRINRASVGHFICERNVERREWIVDVQGTRITGSTLPLVAQLVRRHLFGADGIISLPVAQQRQVSTSTSTTTTTTTNQKIYAALFQGIIDCFEQRTS
jgi:hypothetical protein